MAVVDDYLAVRPEAEAPAAARWPPPGGWRWGPWYIAARRVPRVGRDARAQPAARPRAWPAAFGGAMEVGYLPDMFGHVAQMPQLLRLFGFEHAVVWRGVPSAVDRSGVLVGGPRRLDRAGRVPARRATATARSCPTTPRRSCAASTSSRTSRATLLDRPDPLDERHRPPDAAAVARAGSWPRPTTLDADYELRIVLARRAPARARRPRACRRGRASCARARGPTCSWAWRRTGST